MPTSWCFVNQSHGRVPKGSVMRFEYYLTPEFMDSEFIETGVRPAKNQFIDFGDIEAGKDVRQMFIDLGATTTLRLPDQGKFLQSDDIPRVLVSMKSEQIAKKVNAKEQLDQYLREEMGKFQGFNSSFCDPIRKADRLRGEAGLPDSYIDEFRQKVTQDKEIAHTQKEEREKAAEAAKELEKQRKHNEKSQWIEEHGSDYLKRAFSREYNCHRRYVEERVALEYPGFVVDWEDTAKWKSCACPSEKALDELDKLPDDFEVGWLVRRHDHDPDDYEEGVEREVIFLDNYLGLGVDILKYL